MPLYDWTFVWIVFLIWRKKTDFIGLSMGALLPDLFEPLMMFVFSSYYWHVRNITHSIIGILTIDLLIACITSFWIVPYLLKKGNKRFPNKCWYMFAGNNFLENRNRVRIVFSILIGGMFHLLQDLPTHDGLPLFWPFAGRVYYPGYLVLPTRVIMGIVTAILLVFMIVKYWVMQPDTQ